MGAYLFDAIVHVQARSSIPEKWKRQWKEATTGFKSFLLTEPLVAEIFYQLARQHGENAARNRILWLKSLSTCRIETLDDNLAFEAGRLYLRFRHLGISLTDAFSISTARRAGAEILTTDHGVRDACRTLGIGVNYLPLESLLSNGS